MRLPALQLPAKRPQVSRSATLPALSNLDTYQSVLKSSSVRTAVLHQTPFYRRAPETVPFHEAVAQVSSPVVPAWASQPFHYNHAIEENSVSVKQQKEQARARYNKMRTYHDTLKDEMMERTRGCSLPPVLESPLPGRVSHRPSFMITSMPVIALLANSLMSARRPSRSNLGPNLSSLSPLEAIRKALLLRDGTVHNAYRQLVARLNGKQYMTFDEFEQVIKSLQLFWLLGSQARGVFENLDDQKLHAITVRDLVGYRETGRCSVISTLSFVSSSASDSKMDTMSMWNRYEQASLDMYEKDSKASDSLISKYEEERMYERQKNKLRVQLQEMNEVDKRELIFKYTMKVDYRELVDLLSSKKTEDFLDACKTVVKKQKTEDFEVCRQHDKKIEGLLKEARLSRKELVDVNNQLREMLSGEGWAAVEERVKSEAREERFVKVVRQKEKKDEETDINSPLFTGKDSWLAEGLKGRRERVQLEGDIEEEAKRNPFGQQ